ncbi:NAC domain-containing protein 68-like [Miscanthus floridulus]|uniref:NAC domain-containing protein 68-like n=1 Tax=Miscanthus floridulus TaxID=154761 RepID=UPI003458E855
MYGARPTSPSPAAALYAQLSDVTLVNDFLRPWVTSGDAKEGIAGAYVHTADIYSADPDELARRFQPAVSLDGERVWYFLSPLRTKSPRDRRKVRAVADGTGCWHSEAAPKNVINHLDGGHHVGYRQSFSFMRRGNAGADVRDGWIMAEFHLHNHDENGRSRKVEGLVLCKMYRSPRNRGPAVVPNGDDDVTSVVSLSAETTFSCGKSKAVDDEDSNTMTPRWQRHSTNSDGVATATAMTAPLLTKKAAGDDEVSGMITAVAPSPKNKAVVADDEDLLASPRAHKKMRMAVADAKSSGAELALKATPAGAPAAAAQLHCPQCGFHLATPQALVTLTKSKSVVPRAGDSELAREEQRAVGY